jgi:hypothetical protein
MGSYIVPGIYGEKTRKKKQKESKIQDFGSLDVAPLKLRDHGGRFRVCNDGSADRVGPDAAKGGAGRAPQRGRCPARRPPHHAATHKRPPEDRAAEAVTGGSPEIRDPSLYIFFP